MWIWRQPYSRARTADSSAISSHTLRHYSPRRSFDGGSGTRGGDCARRANLQPLTGLTIRCSKSCPCSACVPYLVFAPVSSRTGFRIRLPVRVRVPRFVMRRCEFCIVCIYKLLAVQIFFDSLLSRTEFISYVYISNKFTIYRWNTVV